MDNTSSSISKFRYPALTTLDRPELHTLDIKDKHKLQRVNEKNVKLLSKLLY